MKVTSSIKRIVLILAFLSIPSIASANPLVEVTKPESTKFKKLGHVSVSSFPGTMDDVVSCLKLKGEREVKNGNHIYISSISNPGDSSRWMATAIVYD